jgi:hypothetical protein
MQRLDCALHFEKNTHTAGRVNLDDYYIDNIWKRRIPAFVSKCTQLNDYKVYFGFAEVSFFPINIFIASK